MTRSKNPAERVAGYSLLEILIVLAIIGMIVALVGPRLFAQLDKSKITAARVQMKSLKSAVMTMRLDIDRFPTGDEGLKLLEKAPTEVEGWGGPYLDGELPKDPWGRDYVYTPPETSNDSPTLSTLGADGKPGGEGNNADIVV